MWQLIVFIFACLLLSSRVTTKEKKSSYSFPKDRKQPCYCDRFSPIALWTSTAKPICAPDLIITISEDAEINFVNQGSSAGKGVPVRGSVIVTGGPLYNDSYILTEVFCRNDAVANQTHVLGTRDGYGTPIAYELFFDNIAYPTAKIRQYPDGILNIIIEVFVEGTCDNSKFNKFAPVLKSIRKFNSTYNSSAADCLSWLIDPLPGNCYYSYPGSAFNSSTLELTPAQIIIQPVLKKRVVISYGQFYETYMKIKNKFGQVVTNLQPTYEQGDRPVIEICDPIKIHWEGVKECMT